MSRWETVNKAKARRPDRKGPNKTEQEYARILEARKQAGEIRDWSFEAVSIRLGQGCWYRPDYMVITDHVEIHEVKGTRGFKLDPQGRVKLRVAAAAHPWIAFYEVIQKTKKNGGGFAIAEVKLPPGVDVWPDSEEF